MKKKSLLSILISSIFCYNLSNNVLQRKEKTVGLTEFELKYQFSSSYKFC